jgi:hypothetical protein
MGIYRTAEPLISAATYAMFESESDFRSCDEILDIPFIYITDQIYTRFMLASIQSQQFRGTPWPGFPVQSEAVPNQAASTKKWTLGGKPLDTSDSGCEIPATLGKLGSPPGLPEHRSSA